ncbi:MAG: ABC transporter substrate-binding protein [Bacillota bacterium]
MSKKSIMLVVLLILLMILAGGCAQDTAVGEEDDILIVAHTAEVTTWDPSSSFSTEVTYMANLYETLLIANPEGSEKPFTPVLAEDWEISDDGLEWTFHLRDGVLFHDGEKMDAAAVKKSLERTISMGEGASFIWSPVESIEVAGELELKFVLTEPAPLDRIVSSSNGAWIMSPSAADQETDWFEAGNAAGTGPYMLQSYKPGEELTLVKFDDYWRGWEGKHCSTVVVKIVSEAIVQRQLLEAGDVHIASVVPVEAISTLESNPEMVVYRGPSFYNYLGFLNTAKPPLDNKLVRQAISYAINYQGIMDIATGGYANQSQGPVPQGLWPWDQDLPQYSFDLDKAKALLVEAGYEDGTLGGIKMVLTYASENPAHTRYAPLIKETLAEIGINLEVQPILWTQQWAMAKESAPEEAQDIFLLLWWPTYADGYDNLSSLFTSAMSGYWNLSYWENATYDHLITEAYSLCAVDVDASRNKYFEAQKLLIDDAVALFFYDPQEIVPMSVKVKGEALNPCYPRVIFFYNLYLE